MAKKDMSVTEYAALRGVTRQHVLKYIADKRQLIGVSKWIKIGHQYILTVEEENISKNS